MAARRKNLKLKNTSAWPDWFAEAVMRWLLKNINPRCKTVSVNLRNTSKSRHGHAYYGSSFTSCSVGRRVPLSKFPYTDHYQRYVWARKIEIKDRLELFVYLVAHEFRHLCKENQGISREGAEHDAEYWAEQRIREFKNGGVWKEIRSKYIEKRRRARLKRRSKEAEPVQDPTVLKIDHARKKLEEWEAKRKRAETHCHKWQKKINRLNGALKRKKAAR